MNAQGEDVVAGIRTPLPVSALSKNVPEAYKELEHTYKKLEKHYRDMLDLEFTIQEGKLYMLQTRVGKRTGIAAVKNRGRHGERRGDFKAGSRATHRGRPTGAVSLPDFRHKGRVEIEPARQRVAGRARRGGRQDYTKPDRAVELKAAGNRVVLVRQETSPDDIHGMNAAAGFLTARGGMTSHAAVVARQMGKVCVAGCEAVEVLDSQTVKIGAKTFQGGRLSLDQWIDR